MDTYNHFQYADALVRSLKLFSTGLDRSRKVLFTSPNSDSLYSVSQRLSEINYPVMVAVDGNDADYDETDSDSLHETSQYFLLVLMPALRDNPDDILQKQKICRLNAEQIQWRMRQDSAKYTQGLIALDGSSFTIRSVGPLGDNLYGVVMGFNVGSPRNFTINPEMWK